MNRSGNTGFNGLVFFGNRGDGLFLLEGGEGILLSFIAQSDAGLSLRSQTVLDKFA